MLDLKKILNLYLGWEVEFFYKKKISRFTKKKFKKIETYLLDEHESFGIYSLYDFIKASSLLDIDKSILKKNDKKLIINKFFLIYEKYTRFILLSKKKILY